MEPRGSRRGSRTRFPHIDSWQLAGHLRAGLEMPLPRGPAALTVPDTPRLPLVTCRRLLGTSGTGLSDAEVVRLVEQLYDVARIVVALHERDRVQVDATVLRALSKDERVDVEERAAVLEFDAGMSRRDATRTALAAYLPTRRNTRKPNHS
jgi:hypothetical protein